MILKRMTSLIKNSKKYIGKGGNMYVDFFDFLFVNSVQIHAVGIQTTCAY